MTTFDSSRFDEYYSESTFAQARLKRHEESNKELKDYIEELFWEETYGKSLGE